MNEIHIGLENKDFVESESSSSKSDKKDGSYSTKPRETIDPEARETETPEETAKPKVTKAGCYGNTKGRAGGNGTTNDY